MHLKNPLAFCQSYKIVLQHNDIVFSK